MPNYNEKSNNSSHPYIKPLHQKNDDDPGTNSNFLNRKYCLHLHPIGGITNEDDSMGDHHQSSGRLTLEFDYKETHEDVTTLGDEETRLERRSVSLALLEEKIWEAYKIPRTLLTVLEEKEVYDEDDEDNSTTTTEKVHRMNIRVKPMNNQDHVNNHPHNEVHNEEQDVTKREIIDPSTPHSNCSSSCGGDLSTKASSSSSLNTSLSTNTPTSNTIDNSSITFTMTHDSDNAEGKKSTFPPKLTTSNEKTITYTYRYVVKGNVDEELYQGFLAHIEITRNVDLNSGIDDDDITGVVESMCLEYEKLLEGASQKKEALKDYAKPERKEAILKRLNHLFVNVNWSSLDSAGLEACRCYVYLQLFLDREEYRGEYIEGMTGSEDNTTYMRLSSAYDAGGTGSGLNMMSNLTSRTVSKQRVGESSCFNDCPRAPTRTFEGLLGTNNPDALFMKLLNTRGRFLDQPVMENILEALVESPKTPLEMLRFVEPKTKATCFMKACWFPDGRLAMEMLDRGVDVVPTSILNAKMASAAELQQVRTQYGQRVCNEDLANASAFNYMNSSDLGKKIIMQRSDLDRSLLTTCRADIAWTTNDDD